MPSAEDKNRHARLSHRCVTRNEKKKKEIPGCVFSAPVLQSRARPGMGIAAFAVYKRVFLPCVWLIGENNLSIAAVCEEQQDIYAGRVLKSRNSRFKGSPTQIGVHVYVHGPCVYTYIYMFCRRLSQRAGSIREQA